MSRDSIKMVAMLTMLINHIANVFLPAGQPLTNLCLCIGYFTAVLGFAVLAQLPYQLAFPANGIAGFVQFNMLFTLLLCFLVLLVQEKIRDRVLRGVCIVLLICASLFCDWALLAPVFTLLFAWAENSRLRKHVAFGVAAVLYGVALAIKPQALLFGPVLAVCFLAAIVQEENRFRAFLRCFGGAALALQREYEFMAAACMDKFMLKTDRRVTKMMLKGYEQDKAANAPQPKYRCLVWACPAHYYTNFTYWTQHCWGVTCVNDMEAMLSYQPITIGDKEQALADLVRCYEKMMMRSHTNGGYVNLLDECWKMCEKFRTNIVIMYDHVSCKNVGGLHGLFEDQARERGIHLIWIPHDVMDPRTVSRREMREAFSQYMVTVLNEKPLDPTLLDYEDALSW